MLAGYGFPGALVDCRRRTPRLFSAALPGGPPPQEGQGTARPKLVHGSVKTARTRYQARRVDGEDALRALATDNATIGSRRVRWEVDAGVWTCLADSRCHGCE